MRKENEQDAIFVSEDSITLDNAIKKMASCIEEILFDRVPSIYLYGSVVLGDFRLGWSDIDFLVLTEKQITEVQAEELLHLRQKLLKEEPQNAYYRSFEGGILSLSAFVRQESDRVVYWGTSGQKITDFYRLDSFCMTQLLESGVLLYGKDIRDNLHMPSYNDLYNDVLRHYETITKYAKKTGRNVYSFGWLLDIARGIYTLQTGKIISKTAAGEWALQKGICSVPEALKLALQVRKDPVLYRNDLDIMDQAESMGDAIQTFALVLGTYLRDFR